ncbi:3-oxoadipate enol-lactonase 2 [Calidithermus roseus]|uniref:3-oxoadipate enol-lactonase 2 n=1 Tax=Calidithermus roseus TaxID=1644118 RepID=A0A399EG40_9DEIN|nr:3-oxoadipate enol-lactonase 2 [Calidithermus roseus]
MLSRTPPEGYIGTCMALREADLRAELGNIRARTLVLCGAEDRSTPPDLAGELARGLGAPLKLIAGAAHLPCVEQPEATLQGIRAFLEELGYVR